MEEDANVNIGKMEKSFFCIFVTQDVFSFINCEGHPPILCQGVLNHVLPLQGVEEPIEVAKQRGQKTVQCTPS